jgi:hypothetical protein
LERGVEADVFSEEELAQRSGPPRPLPFDRTRYVPVILTRQGERLALRELRDPARDAMTPIFVAHPIANEPGTNAPVRSVADHLDRLARALLQDWGTNPAFVDLRFVDTSGPDVDGVHPLTFFVLRCGSGGLSLAPVIAGAHSEAYRAAAVDAATRAGTALAIRLGPTEWPDLGSALGDGHVMGLLSETGRPPEQVHVIMDMEHIPGPTEVVAAALRPALRSLPQLSNWASVTVVGTGMPRDTRAVGPGGDAHVPRLEWTLWRSLSERNVRRPSFGDYGVQHPDPVTDFDPRFMDSAAQLRYTTDHSWYVVRGRALKRHGREQIHDLANRVVSDATVYSGPGFSWGDDWLLRCAKNLEGPGDQRTWRKATTNHHLTLVADQIATHPVP